MPVTVRQHPEFSWSHSRARLLEDDCARRYYWNYYGSWRGWQSDADEEARIAYRLKQLTTLPMVLGQAVHERAREMVLAVQEGAESPTLDVMRERTRAALNRVWRGARDKAGFFRAPKRIPMLLEPYYGLAISNDRIALTKSKMERCLDYLHDWPGWTRLRECDQNDILLFEPTKSVEYDGLRLYAAPDLVYRTPDGAWTILDWKTGEAEAAEDQLSLYALYLLESDVLPGFDGTARGLIINLDEGEERVIEIRPEHLASARERIRSSEWRMRGLLVGLDAERNEAQPRDRFALPVDTERCRWCPFYELCEGEIQAARHFGPF
jgi:hypothetical protein